MTGDGPWAHTPGKPGEPWHPLRAHLVDVAERAGEFAESFGGQDLAKWVGLWHDVGKCNPRWQEYLQANHEGKPHAMVPHAIWGASLAYRLLAKAGGLHNEWKEIALPIQGHHAGLDHGEEIGQKLQNFLNNNPDALSIMWEFVRSLPPVPELPRSMPDELRRELFIRMVFSALVDADSLDTEGFKDQATAGLRRWHERAEDERARRAMIRRLWEEFKRDQRDLLRKAREAGGAVNAMRREIYETCRLQGAQSQGIYRLTVPTGGGKTRSALAFALKHATRWDLRRIIVAIPYTSIIDQTAKEYRDIFKGLGSPVVLEHHSQVDPPDDESLDDGHLRLQLAVDNWDAPIVVTTTVQLFESLFSNRRSRVRKLHNIARSVIVLDEVQTLPPHLLEPTADVLRTLTEEYQVTVVLSTATQPALEEVTRLKTFHGVQMPQIVKDYQRHFRDLRRVEYLLRTETLTWSDVASEIRGHEQALAVVNTRRDAIALVNAVGRKTPGLFHLSAMLCGAHRRKVIQDVQTRLDARNPLPVRLISTQVIEAGVNLDFPWACRALGPFDRITQTAGRCNREGKLPGSGQVVIFKPQDGHVPQGAYGAYRFGVDEAQQMLDDFGTESLHDPDRQREYFRRLYDGLIPLDAKRIQRERKRLNYPKVAELYRLIEEDTVPVVVDYEDGIKRLHTWVTDPSRRTWQQLQPYVVNIYRRELSQFDLSIEKISEGLYRWIGQYNELLGLPIVSDPSDPEDSA